MNESRKTILTIGVLLTLSLIALAIEWLLETVGRRWLALIWVSLIALILLLGIHFSHASARDLGQWTNNDPEVSAWYKSLMQPDAPGVSCCGEADAYWCDEIHVRDSRTYCNITDDRDDAPRMRPHIDVGTEIAIPDNKLTWKDGNPTGHSVVFISRYGYVYCFVQSSGT